MMTIVAALIATAAWQQPQVLPQDPPPRTSSDTTLFQVVAIGRAVAEVKAEFDRFRMLALNDDSGRLMESSDVFRTRCQELAVAAQKAGHTMCRSCLTRSLQPAINQYRAFMPSLARLGTRCASTLGRLRVADPVTAAGNLRRGARNMSSFMVAGLRQYEARLMPVRQALTAPPPRRGG
jgi:hypothetical protein